jgi:hypothetical protein
MFSLASVGVSEYLNPGHPPWAIPAFRSLSLNLGCNNSAHSGELQAIELDHATIGQN